MESIFTNNYGRLRSGWRAGIFVLIFLFFAVGWGVVEEMVTSISALGINGDGLLFWSASLGFFLVVATVAGLLCGKLLEGLPLKTLGWTIYRGWFIHLISGFIIGAATLAFACLIAFVAGGMSFTLNDSAGTSAIGITLVVSGIVFVLGAAFEEVMFRGYLMQTFTRAGLPWVAIAVTSLFFAWGHFQNPNVGWLALVNILLAGLWFSVLYLKTRSLWLPFSAHFAWNWFQGAIFGIPVSGITKVTTAPLLVPVDSGPVWLTGGNFGVEGGVACTIAILLSTAFMWFLPFLKADEKMLELTNSENPIQAKYEN